MIRKYRDAFVDRGPTPGPDLPHTWHEELLGEAPQRHDAAPNGLDGLDHAAN